MTRLFPLKTWLILVAVAILCLLVVSWCSRGERIEQAKDQATIGSARTESAQDAIAAIGDNAAANSETQTEVKEAQDAIRQADPVDRDRVARDRLRCLQRPDPSC